VLPPYEHLVIDEAHHLEDEATRQFGYAGSEKALTEMLERCESLPRSVQEIVKGAAAALAPYDELAGAISSVQGGAASSRARLREFCQACGQFLDDHAMEGGEYEQRLHLNRAMRVQPDWPRVEMAWENLKLVLGETAAALERLLGLLSGESFAFLNKELILAETAGLLQDAKTAAYGLAAAIEEDNPARVVWMERERDGGMLVSWVPLAVAGLLQEHLYGERASVLLTGATLSSGGDFSYLQERLGMGDAETLALGSPFDFRRAALLLLPRDMPEPNWPEYNDALALAVVDLARASQGRALVLFTSHASLRAVHAAVSEPLRREGIAVLGQGIDGSPRQLVRALQARPDTVLLGTSSFWEGVDVAGEALSLLVIAKLPFAVPTEPVTAARSALYDDPFAQYTVPQAILRFKQGFGRLIRRKTDRGVVAVLDRRILSRQYGEAFTGALPQCTARQALLREMPGLVAQWLEGER
jgi:DNA polymerase-3 subunit epsilon/ATP-dependent DNA helicase DinG